ncbi:hypothetical protein E2C01_069130 [Portunus trituberculatus]|uniref:Uncharacterized protein n=1 Tax=Portunus trituberculatus TaxID=210409 RepID=A0A5B7HY26_PORTR|nr:hypothetical protein [Portunus trituberculatus]
MTSVDPWASRPRRVWPGEMEARGVAALAGSRGVVMVSGWALLVVTAVVARGPAWLVLYGRGRLLPHYLASTATLLATCCSAALLTSSVRTVLVQASVRHPCDRLRLQGVVFLTNTMHLVCLTAAVTALAWTPATLGLSRGLRDVYAFHQGQYNHSEDSRLMLDGLHRAMHCCGLLRGKAMETLPWSCCDTRRALCRPFKHGGLHPADSFTSPCDSEMVRRLHVVHALLDAAAVVAATLAVLHRLLLLHFFSSVRTVRPKPGRVRRRRYPLLGLVLA